MAFSDPGRVSLGTATGSIPMNAPSTTTTTTTTPVAVAPTTTTTAATATAATTGEGQQTRSNGGTAFWGRVCSNTQRVSFRADLRGKRISFGRSSHCAAMLPVLMWISGEHFVLHYVDPRAKNRHRAHGTDASGDSSLEADDDYDDDDDDDEEDESYVLVEDKSRFGTWLNGVLIGRDCSMRAQDGDVITIRAPTRHAPNPAGTGKIELISLVLRILTKAERLKQERFLILPSHPINDKYDILNTLGEGQYSVVYEAVQRGTGRHVAVKVVSEETTLKTQERAAAALKNINREMELMSTVKHPCCIQIYDRITYYQTHCFVLELAENDLFDYIRTNGPLREDVAQCLFVQMLSAIKYLHGLHIVHRDLKPENMLLVQDGDCLIVKVTDFGLATIVDQNHLAQTLCGTPQYVSPEIVMNRKSSTAHGYGSSVDMWSLGAVLYTMLSATTPFNDKDPHIYEHILRGAVQFPPDRWAHVSADAQGIVRGLMTVDVAQRLTSAQCMARPWCRQGLQRLAHTASDTLKALATEELAHATAAAAAATAAAGAETLPAETSSTPLPPPPREQVLPSTLKRDCSVMEDDDVGQTPPKRPHVGDPHAVPPAGPTFGL